MQKKIYFCFLSVLLMVLLVGCRTATRRVLNDLEYYGYRVELVEDEEEKSKVIFGDYIVNLYKVYNSEDVYLANLYEMESEDTLIEALEEEGYRIGDFPHNKNMMLILKHEETLDLIIVFYGNDLSKLTAN